MYKNNSIERECYKLRLILNTELFHIHDYSAYKDYSTKKGDYRMLYCMLHCSFDMESRIFISNSFENMFVASTNPFLSNIREQRNIISFIGFLCSQNSQVYSCSCNTEHFFLIVCLHFSPFITYSNVT